MAWVGPLDSCGPRDVTRSFLPRGRASGRTYKLIAVLVDNCCACLVFCWLICVRFCVTFSFILCVVYFVIKFIKYNDWSFPSLGGKWTPHRVQRETRQLVMTVVSGLCAALAQVCRLRTALASNCYWNWFWIFRQLSFFQQHNSLSQPHVSNLSGFCVS